MRWLAIGVGGWLQSWGIERLTKDERDDLMIKIEMEDSVVSAQH